jgi:hypothetical protein
VHWACRNLRPGPPERQDCSAKASASSLNQTEWAQRDERAVRPPLCLGRVTIQVPRQKPLRAKSGARVHNLIPRYLPHKLLHWLAARTERGLAARPSARNNKSGEGVGLTWEGLGGGAYLGRGVG